MKKKKLLTLWIYIAWREGSISALKACWELHISSPTFYRRVAEIKRNVDVVKEGDRNIRPVYKNSIEK